MSNSTKIAQELWDNIIQNLPRLSALKASRVFHFRLPPARYKHTRVWEMIFKSQEWLDEAKSQGINPVLIGYDLENCYNSSQKGDEKNYLILQPGDMSGDFTTYNEESRQLFFSCLQPYNFDQASNEVRFSSGLVINIKAVLDDPEILMVPDLTKLFSINNGRPEGRYLFWQHNGCALGRLDHSNIVGIDGKAKRISQVDNICCLTLSESGMHTDHPSQYYFRRIGFNSSLLFIGKSGKDGWRL